MLIAVGRRPEPLRLSIIAKTSELLARVTLLPLAQGPLEPAEINCLVERAGHTMTATWQKKCPGKLQASWNWRKRCFALLLMGEHLPA